MITFSKIGKKGHLGNQLFQIASTIGIAIKNKRKFSFLLWKHQSSFKNKLPLLSADLSDFSNLEEQEYHHYEWNFAAENYDISGWLQTEKYFDKELTKHYFEFSDSLTEKIKNQYKKAFEKRTILISIRRGDFVNHADYFQLSIKYYLNSLAAFFPDLDAYNLIVLSDDIKYCKFHFSFLENAYFGDGLNEAEQLCLGSLCDDFIIGNSTFSWWSAWLGEKTDSKIIRPLKNFDNLKSQELNDKDYFPERWTRYNHLEKKIKLEDVAFYLKQNKNTEEIKKYISYYFDVELVSKENEIDNRKSIYVLNKDCILPPVLIYYSFLKVKKSNLDVVVNHLVNVFKVSKALNYKEFLVQNDFGLFSSIFSFPENKKKAKIQHGDIYLKRSNLVDFEKEKIQKKHFLIHFSGGQFKTIGGYKFSFRRFVKKRKIKFKKRIKKLLLRK